MFVSEPECHTHTSYAPLAWTWWLSLGGVRDAMIGIYRDHYLLHVTTDSQFLPQSDMGISTMYESTALVAVGD
jgi:hypothetical protein